MKIATRKLTERANAELPKRMASVRAGEGDKLGCRAAGRLLWSIVGFLLVLNWAVSVDPQTDPATNNLLTVPGLIDVVERDVIVVGGFSGIFPCFHRGSWPLAS